MNDVRIITAKSVLNSPRGPAMSDALAEVGPDLKNVRSEQLIRGVYDVIVEYER